MLDTVLITKCIYSIIEKFSPSDVVGTIVPAVIAVLAAVTAFFYRLKLKSVEKAYSQVYSVHTTQQQTDVPVAFSTSPGSNAVSCMRIMAPSASFGHDLQPPNTGSTAPFPMFSVSEIDTRGITVPFDQPRLIYGFWLCCFTLLIFLRAILTQASSKGTACRAAVCQQERMIISYLI